VERDGAAEEADAAKAAATAAAVGFGAMLWRGEEYDI